MDVLVEMYPRDIWAKVNKGAFKKQETVDIIKSNTTVTGRLHSFYPGGDQYCLRVAFNSLNINSGLAELNDLKNDLKDATITGQSSRAQGTVVSGSAGGFEQKLIRRDYVQDIVAKAKELVAAAATLKNEEKARRFFGSDLTPAQLQQINKSAEDLKQGVQGAKGIICWCTKNWDQGSVHKADKGKYFNYIIMYVGQGFTWHRYNFGERVATFVHELTHWFLDFDDQDFTEGEKAEGPYAFALAQAAGRSSNCIINPDNWAYYVCSYHKNDGHDWSHLEEHFVKNRERIEGDGRGLPKDDYLFPVPQGSA